MKYFFTIYKIFVKHRYWTLDVSWTASYEITLVRLSVNKFFSRLDC